MGSVKDYEYLNDGFLVIKDKPIIHPVFQNICNKHFPPLSTPKTDTREEEKQEGRQKPKKRRDDE